jgi:ribose transport system substrate-binding protein
MTIRVARAIAAVIIGAGAAACGPDQSAQQGAPPALESGPFTIALIAKSSTNPVFLAARAGAEAAARELSQQHGLQIEIAWMTPPQEDGQLQAQRIEQAVNDGVDAILLSSSDADKVTGAVDDAVDRGVPVMTFDSDVAQSKRFAFYGVDNVESGHAVMRELATLLNGEGAIAILAGNQNAPNLQLRAQGVRDEAAKYPGIRVVATFNHIETPHDAAAEVIRVMNAYPEITGWAMVGGWPLFTQTLLSDLDPARVQIVSIDALPAQLAYVEKGIAPVLLAQPVFQWGYVGVTTILDKVHFNRDVPEILPMELMRVTRENLGEWARQLQAWGFTDVPASYIQN